MAVEVACALPEGANASGVRLCEAVRAQIPVPPEAGMRLVVSVAQARHLRARLEVGTGRATREGPDLDTRVTDRDTIPDGALTAFARQLIHSIR